MMDSACESIFPSAVVTRVVRFVIAVEFAVIFPFAVDKSLVSWVMALPCAVIFPSAEVTRVVSDCNAFASALLFSAVLMSCTELFSVTIAALFASTFPEVCST